MAYNWVMTMIISFLPFTNQTNRFVKHKSNQQWLLFSYALFILIYQ